MLKDELPAIPNTIEGVMAWVRSNRPKPKTGPVMCNKCGKEWMACECESHGVTHNLFAFHDAIGGTYKVWTCTDVVFITHEDEGKENSVLMLYEELTRIAKAWLTLPESGNDIHEHEYVSTLDPRFEACNCGVARKIESAA